MIKSMHGITQEPFVGKDLILLPDQKEAFDIIKAHSHHGGLSIVTGDPGVGKSVLRESIEKLVDKGDSIVFSISKTMHTYQNILKQIGASMKLDVSLGKLEGAITEFAYRCARERKTIFTIIDEAHLIDMNTLRKLRLLFDEFPKNHNLVLIGQRELMYYLSMKVNLDIKTRITYSKNLQILKDSDLDDFIKKELLTVGLGANIFDDAAIELVIRSVEGNLRLCCNLCYGGLLNASLDKQKFVKPQNINAILVQPHWRSHEDLITGQVI